MNHRDTRPEPIETRNSFECLSDERLECPSVSLSLSDVPEITADIGESHSDNNILPVNDMQDNAPYAPTFVPTSPERASYSKPIQRGENNLIMSDSTMKRINKLEFSANVQRGSARIKCFPGATTKTIHHYLLPEIVEENYDSVVLHCGINDIRNNNYGAVELAHDIFNIGRSCDYYGVKRVIFSGITNRWDGKRIEEKRLEINRILRRLCENQGYTYIDNDNIDLNDVVNTRFDHVHLLDSGTIKLANNVLNVLNYN